ncbi:NAD(P)/FAD-dependent oxidoreductase [Paenibacillus sp. UNC451MF]|uniref:NAD(P)/FAD-dependent oxidoreductase n=1 Tax=Paenibacillus sp. UNC451MF TaxID=1449063 RepID=UPI00048D0A3A|nr:NAD(P)/FAD-dependent oxidoreductase [Paenibacillus sp. UNC451MF]
MHHLDTAVIGAGIAGSTLARALAVRGWETLLIDRKKFPRHKVCGEFLSPESQSMLKSLGLSEYVESLQPSVISRIRLILSNGKVLEIPLPGIALGVSRYLLDSTLHSAALSSGVHIQTSTTVTSVSPNNKGYLIETKQGDEHRTYQVRALIAAWGANCRTMLPGPHPKGSINNSYMGVKSHFRGVGMEPVIELYFFEGGYLGISSIGGGVVNVSALLKRKAFQNGDKTVLGLLYECSRRNPILHQKLADAIPVPETQTAVAPVDLTRKPVAWDRIPLVGDAVLTIPPLCGDGMSMALRSAQLCAPLADSYLAGDITWAKWQRDYSRSILREFRGPLQWGRLLQRLFDVPLLSQLLVGAAHYTPGIAYGLVQATRLKENNE